MRLKIFSLVVSLTVVGCAAEVDAPVGSAVAAARPPVTVELTSPTVDSRTATPLTSLKLQFSHRYNPATVNATTIMVIERESLRQVPVTFDTSGRDAVVVIPSRPLGTGARYHVIVDGVFGNNGVPVTAYDGRFYTQFHFQTYIVGYRDDGRVFKWIDGTYDAAGGVWNALYTYAGDDGVIRTADDRENQLSRYFYNAVGDNERVVVHSGTGADGVYETADDTYTYERTLAWDGVGLQSLYYTAAGADGVFATADDSITSNHPRYYDAEDRTEFNCREDGGGAVQSCTRMIYSSATSKAYVTLSGPGADGTWRTDDDTMNPTASWRLYTLDGNGLTTRIDNYALDGAGARTASDSLRTGYTVYTHTATGLSTEAASYTGAGPDGTWGTADDFATTRTTTTYDGSGLTATQDTYQAGPDGAWGTTDDWQQWHREW